MKILVMLLLLLALTMSSCTPATTTTTPPTTAPLVITIEQTNMAVIDHLARLAQSPAAKQLLADFYDNFAHGEIYIWYNSNLVEVNYDKDYAGIAFEYYEVARFPMPSDPRGGTFVLPEVFTKMLKTGEEVIHPARVDSPETKEVTIALRWLVNSHTGQVKTVNPNALRLEAALTSGE